MTPAELKAVGFWEETFLHLVLSGPEYESVMQAHGDVPDGQVTRLRKRMDGRSGGPLVYWSLVYPSIPKYNEVLRRLVANDVLWDMVTTTTRVTKRSIEEVD